MNTFKKSISPSIISSQSGDGASVTSSIKPRPASMSKCNTPTSSLVGKNPSVVDSPIDLVIGSSKVEDKAGLPSAESLTEQSTVEESAQLSNSSFNNNHADPCTSNENAAESLATEMSISDGDNNNNNISVSQQQIIDKLKTAYNNNLDSKNLSERQFFAVLVLFSSLVLGLVAFSANNLPPVLDSPAETSTEFSELLARQHLKEILTWGFRPAGSHPNEKLFPQYIKEQVQKMVKNLGQAPIQSSVEITKDCGSFGLDFLGGFASSYCGVTNTIVKLSSPEHHQSENSLLINCHTDSAMGALGASDDAVACSVMLEMIRALLSTGKPLKAPLIFLFNGAEENILQGSHAFIKNNKHASGVKAFVNLEAAGAGGKELVFQTGPNSPWLAQVWARNAPHPFGSVFAEELFQSGIIPSDTDFRIFRDFGNIPGIDLAYMKNGYVYHTEFDNEHMINKGSIQRAGDNILSVVKALVQQKDSYIHDSSKYEHGRVGFFDIVGFEMIVIPIRILYIFNWSCYLLVLAHFARRMYKPSRTDGCSGKQYGMRIAKAITSIFASLTCMYLGPIAVATLLTITGSTMSFYSDWRIAVLLYLPPALFAYIRSMRFFYKYFFSDLSPNQIDATFKEAVITILTVGEIALTLKGLQTSVFLTMALIPNLIRRFYQIYLHDKVCKLENSESCPRWWKNLAENKFVQNFREAWQGNPQYATFCVQIASNFTPILVFMQHSNLLMDFFIPLTGRMGTGVPSDVIVAVLVALNIVPLMVIVSDSVHYVKSFAGFYKTTLSLTLFMFTACVLGFFFPYQKVPHNMAPMRLVMQHQQRTFFDIQGRKSRQDSSFWFNCIDYRCPHIKTGYKPIDEAENVFGAPGLFSHQPWYYPIDHVVKHIRHVPAPPPMHDRIRDHPLQVRFGKRAVEVIAENSTHTEYSYTINMLVYGSTHSGLYIGPLQSQHSRSKLMKWSIDANPDDVARKPSQTQSGAEGYYFDDTFFVYRYSGETPEPWKVQLQLRVVSTEPPMKHQVGRLHPSVELGVTTHYVPWDKGHCGTPEANEVKRSLNDFITMVCWESQYENYLL